MIKACFLLFFLLIVCLIFFTSSPSNLDNKKPILKTCGGKSRYDYFCVGTNDQLCHEMDQFYYNPQEPVGKLCQIMNKYNSDKCTRHNYTNFYEFIFKKFNGKPITLLEVGLGTNNMDTLSTMGVNGSPGASLRGWREYFPMARIYGADVDGRVLFEEDRITTFYVDILNNATIDAMFRHFGVEAFDIIIEDSYHIMPAQINFLSRAFSKLKPDGIFVTEDVRLQVCEEFYQTIKSFPFMKASLVHTESVKADSILAIYQKVS